MPDGKPTTATPELPWFVFRRSHEVEASNNWLLTGVLLVAAPMARKPLPKLPPKRYRYMVDEIVSVLVVAAKSGTLPVDGFVVAWRNGDPPEAFAAFEPDDATFEAWRARSWIVRMRAVVEDGGNIGIDLQLHDADDGDDENDRDDEERPTLH